MVFLLYAKRLEIGRFPVLSIDSCEHALKIVSSCECSETPGGRFIL